MVSQQQKAHASTQKFTEIIDIADNIVVFEGGFASIVIEVTASNFSLQSKAEQDAKMFAYAALLNSLNFPIQIIIRNKRVDISSYITALESEEAKTSNELLKKHIGLYKEFIKEMVTINIVLNKSFYIVASYSSLEKGVSGLSASVDKNGVLNPTFVNDAKKALFAKADAILGQLQRLTLPSKVLEKEELVKLFYDIYNEGEFEVSQVGADMQSPFVKPMK